MKKFLFVLTLLSTKSFSEESATISEKTYITNANYIYKTEEFKIISEDKSKNLNLSLSKDKECFKNLHYSFKSKDAKDYLMEGSFCLIKTEQKENFYYYKDSKLDPLKRISYMEKNSNFWNNYLEPDGLNLHFVVLDERPLNQKKANELCPEGKSFIKGYKILFSLKAFSEEELLDSSSFISLDNSSLCE